MAHRYMKLNHPPSVSRIGNVNILLLCLIVFAVIYIFYQGLDCNPFLKSSSSRTTHSRQTYIPARHNLSNFKIKVIKSPRWVTLEEINAVVFDKYGFDIVEPTLPIPKLMYIDEPNCEEVFAEWIQIAQSFNPSEPPKTIVPSLEKGFTLEGYAGLQYTYHNDYNSKGGQKPEHWNEISEMMKWPLLKISQLSYGSDGLSVYYAMKNHKIEGLNGFVVGSMQPWVEVFALLNGAKHLITVEYNKLEVQPEFADRLEAQLPLEFAKKWHDYAGKLDFAVTYSSIEHSGLGRYGDPIDPNGDLREMKKIACLLKPGGLLFLGLPQGTDAIVYNLHRIYGSIRLAMLFAGFDWIGTYSGASEEPYDLNMTSLNIPAFSFQQLTLVLRKANS